MVGEEGPPGLGRRGVPHAWAGILGGAEPALSGRDGARSGQGVRGPPPTDAPPTRARERRRVRTPTRGRESGYGTGLIGPKKPEAVVSKTWGCGLNFLKDEPQEMAVPPRASKALRRGLKFSKGWPRIVERSGFNFLRCHR